ncbi:L-seryl-tRNA(Sec) selenium transferase [Sporanaerobacter sp. PP17-6a]|uniref:L-seryl-tRNA(Sec) selenium transferase n=1 Tax=Sporanaerobacter sp. PP17-6a TaxID=1891289 RepID=UPI00089FAD04|nr:L-seryl-tRNA(Sec) selenium transferase [Sporanaerobacter sp. PP17-6a]SCL84231.1 L-seryl-tRNA(Sec) selenium transferase [Sporanaerobacter sp. PP17-6a]
MENKNLFKLIPKVDELLEDSIIEKYIDYVPRKIIVNSIRDETDLLRKKIKDGRIEEKDLVKKIEELPKAIGKRIEDKNKFNLRKVINGTGVVLHTNLGRSMLSSYVLKGLEEISTNYSNLEFNLETGERGSRYSHVEELLKSIAGCESAIVVNNNAAAVLLVLNTVAKEKEVIISRGELIEIGDSFRIPEVMEESGAHLLEVGTTNKTHLWDYENAINERTGALLKVHTSNYKILGFTSSVSVTELCELKDKYGIPVIEDLGSGTLIDFSKYGMEYEPTVQDSVKNGGDIITFSGDKLLGGPQAGIIVGRKTYIDKMKKNPLTRAFRIDKLTLCALEETLRLYLDEEKAVEMIPTLSMLTLKSKELENRGIKLYNRIKECIDKKFADIDLVDDYSEVGGGSFPLGKFPTKCIMLSLKNIRPEEYEKRLRNFKVPIIARIYKDNIYLDLRTIMPDDYDVLIEGLLYGLTVDEGV